MLLNLYFSALDRANHCLRKLQREEKSRLKKCETALLPAVWDSSYYELQFPPGSPNAILFPTASFNIRNWLLVALYNNTEPLESKLKFIETS